MNVVLLGAPGSGKGTQARRIEEAFKLQHISTGDIFREAIGKQTPLGVKVQGFVSKGALVPDELVVEVVAGKLEMLEGSFLLDGFPRTEEQAMAFDAWLKRSGRVLDRVVHLKVVPEELVKRLGGRFTCKGCGAIYNLNSQPPQKPGVCDKDGGALYQREDDKPEAVKKRLAVYDAQTKPLVAYYKKTGALTEVEGAQDPGAVFEQIRKALAAAAGAGL